MPMEIIPLQEAQNSLSQLVERAAAGETIIISKHNRAEAFLCPMPPAKPKRRIGSMEGMLVIPDEFYEPLPPDILAAFEGEEGK